MFRRFGELFCKKLQKVPHFVKTHEKPSIWPNYATFSNKLPCFGVSVNFWAKGSKKLLNSWKSTKNHPFGQIFSTFRTNYHVFAFPWTFPEKVAKSASFREKARKTIDLAKTFNVFSKLPCLGIFMNFSARSCKKCLISWKSTRNHWFGQKYATFSNKLPCLCISINFSEKSCKKCLISWNSKKNHWFGQNLQLFRTKYHVYAFRWTFQQKVAKSASFREKARKIIHLAKTLQLFEQTTMSLHFDELFRKKLQKVPHFVRKHEKLSIWRKLATFRANYHVFFGIFMNFSAKSCKKCLIWWKSTRNHRFAKNYPTFWTNYHVFAFWWTFKEKVGKRGSFREKARKLVDLVKTCNFSRKLPCFDVSMHFSAKIAKTASFCEKARQLIDLAKTMQLFRTNYHVLVFRWTFQPKVAQSGSILEGARKFIDLAKTLQLFEQTTMSLHFDELFRRKLQKVPHFVKKHGKPSIWPKLATFGANYHVLAFSWTFQQGGAKSASFREKARETIDLANTMQLFEQTTMFLHFDELLRKRLEKVVHLVKKHEKSWIWSKLATFRTNCHVFVFRWTFKEKVGKSASFHEKVRELMHFLKTCNFSKKLPCFDVSMNFSAKSCKKCLISWKSTKNHRFGQNFQLF